MHFILSQNTPKSYHNMTTNQEWLKGSVLTFCFWNCKTPKKYLIHCALSKVSIIFEKEWYLFFDTTKLSQHVSAVHNNEKSYSCQFCNKKFGLDINLGSHIKFVCNKIRNFSCIVFKKKFATKFNLERHRKLMH